MKTRAIVSGSLVLLLGLGAGFALGRAVSVDIKNLPQGTVRIADQPINPAYPGAYSKKDLAFFQAAARSCKALKATGATMRYQDGKYDVIGPAKNKELFVMQFDASDKQTGGYYPGYPHLLCMASDLNAALVKGKASTLGSEFLLDDLGGGQFAWHSHQGSPDVTNAYFQVAEGRFNQVTLNGSAGGWTADVVWGLTPQQAKLLQAQN